MEALRRVLVAILLTYAAAVFAHGEHKHPGPPLAPAGLQGLDVYRDAQALHVLTVEQGPEDPAPAIRHKRSVDGGVTWTAPVRVDRAGAVPHGMRPGNDAQVAAAGDRVVAVWSVAGTGWGGSGPFASALSSNGGKTWVAAPTPSDSGMTTGHAFADLLFTADALHAVWLDGRDKAQGLRHAVSSDYGAQWSKNSTVAAQTCECCWNTLAPAPGGGAVVLYRSKGPRDMNLAILQAGAWQRRGPVAAFGWEVKGCPETGGALAFDASGGLHALSWTGLAGKEGLYHSMSQDAGRRWGRPRRVGSDTAQHGDLAASGDVVMAVWDEVVSGKSVVRAARLRGGHWAAPAMFSAPDGEASHPRVLATRDGFVAFWGERTAGGQRELRMRRLGASARE